MAPDDDRDRRPPGARRDVDPARRRRAHRAHPPAQRGSLRAARRVDGAGAGRTAPHARRRRRRDGAPGHAPSLAGRGRHRAALPGRARPAAARGAHDRDALPARTPGQDRPQWPASAARPGRLRARVRRRAGGEPAAASPPASAVRGAGRCGPSGRRRPRPETRHERARRGSGRPLDPEDAGGPPRPPPPDGLGDVRLAPSGRGPGAGDLRRGPVAAAHPAQRQRRSSIWPARCAT